jgi:hypothetical protein
MCRVAFAVFLGFGLASLGSAASSEAGEVQQMKDQETGWMVYTACAGKTCVSVVPQAGCNVFSIVHDGQEMLKKPKSLKDLPGFMYGNPVCYPTPNRVANAEFLFEGKTYKFPANNGKNFLQQSGLSSSLSPTLSSWPSLSKRVQLSSLTQSRIREQGLFRSAWHFILGFSTKGRELRRSCKFLQSISMRFRILHQRG